MGKLVRSVTVKFDHSSRPQWRKTSAHTISQHLNNSTLLRKVSSIVLLGLNVFILFVSAGQ